MAHCVPKISTPTRLERQSSCEDERNNNVSALNGAYVLYCTLAFYLLFMQMSVMLEQKEREREIVRERALLGRKYRHNICQNVIAQDVILIGFLSIYGNCLHKFVCVLLI